MPALADTTITAQLHHPAFSLAASAAWIRGDHSAVNWSESWRIREVTAAEWAAPQERTRAAGAELRQAIEQHALVAAIRQKAAAVRG